MKIVFHSSFTRHYGQLQSQLPHALLIVGEKGMGAETVARDIASQHSKHIYTITPEKDEKPHPDGTIGVERIRELHTASRTRTNSIRIIHIVDAHKMTAQSQNAFLKLLEEPNSNTHFILSAHTTQPLLATVLSRVQTVELRPVTNEQSTVLLDAVDVTDPKTRAQTLFIASGKPAEILRLANSPDSLTAYSGIINDARKLLQGSAYEKLITVNIYKDSRPGALNLLDATIRLLRMSYEKTPDNQQLLVRLEDALVTVERLQRNANIRLALMRFVL